MALMTRKDVLTVWESVGWTGGRRTEREPFENHGKIGKSIVVRSGMVVCAARSRFHVHRRGGVWSRSTHVKHTMRGNYKGKGEKVEWNGFNLERTGRQIRWEKRGRTAHPGYVGRLPADRSLGAERERGDKKRSNTMQAAFPTGGWAVISRGARRGIGGKNEQPSALLINYSSEFLFRPVMWPGELNV